MRSFGSGTSFMSLFPPNYLEVEPWERLFDVIGQGRKRKTSTSIIANKWISWVDGLRLWGGIVWQLWWKLAQYMQWSIPDCEMKWLNRILKIFWVSVMVQLEFGFENSGAGPKMCMRLLILDLSKQFFRIRHCGVDQLFWDWSCDPKIAQFMIKRQDISWETFLPILSNRNSNW